MEALGGGSLDSKAPRPATGTTAIRDRALDTCLAAAIVLTTNLANYRLELQP